MPPTAEDSGAATTHHGVDTALAQLKNGKDKLASITSLILLLRSKPGKVHAARKAGGVALVLETIAANEVCVAPPTHTLLRPAHASERVASGAPADIPSVGRCAEI